ncbi:hypothetical protein GCM10008967_10190 [Bacillus carboniphilus]|uniref:YCII-related domain-containing protein n=1 Tax=Bacillus carboniphilus TaxID=86663 RepID=A0ABP3FMW8_9BACI
MALQQFLYKLTLVPNLHDDGNWTERENNIVGEHFRYLQGLQKEGKLILAGRTMNESAHTFGIVIFLAESETEAKQIMENDPAVDQGVMIAEVFPYKVALFNNQFEG